MLPMCHVAGNLRIVFKFSKLISMTVSLMASIEMLAYIIQKGLFAIGNKELVNQRTLFSNYVVMMFHKRHV